MLGNTLCLLGRKPRVQTLCVGLAREPLGAALLVKGSARQLFPKSVNLICLKCSFFSLCARAAAGNVHFLRRCEPSEVFETWGSLLSGAWIYFRSPKRLHSRVDSSAGRCLQTTPH